MALSRAIRFTTVYDFTRSPTLTRPYDSIAGGRRVPLYWYADHKLAIQPDPERMERVKTSEIGRRTIGIGLYIQTEDSPKIDQETMWCAMYSRDPLKVCHAPRHSVVSIYGIPRHILWIFQPHRCKETTLKVMYDDLTWESRLLERARYAGPAG